MVILNFEKGEKKFGTIVTVSVIWNFTSYINFFSLQQFTLVDFLRKILKALSDYGIFIRKYEDFVCLKRVQWSCLFNCISRNLDNFIK